MLALAVGGSFLPPSATASSLTRMKQASRLSLGYLSSVRRKRSHSTRRLLSKLTWGAWPWAYIHSTTPMLLMRALTYTPRRAIGGTTLVLIILKESFPRLLTPSVGTTFLFSKPQAWIHQDSCTESMRHRRHSTP